MFCKNCGHELSEDAVFCPKCGTKIEAIPAIQQKPPSKEIKIKYCSNCASTIDEKVEFCPKCGLRVSMPPIMPEKRNSGVAAVLSLVIPGAGQIYCGRINRGVIILITSVILVFVIIGIIEWVWNIYDAYDIAEKINREELNRE